MSSLVGYITATYDELVAFFGKPTYPEWSGDMKVSTEWELELDGEWVRIYDWKESSELVCRSGKPYRWHIGGESRWALDTVEDCLDRTGTRA